jgi:3-hydroxyacyl-[acyl-carrier-protein] dehydratase
MHKIQPKGEKIRFYFLDRITKYDLGESVEGCKCWTLSEDIFEQHFPGYPVVPGVFIIESMAQLMGFLIEKSYSAKYPESHGVYAVLSIVHKAKFKNFVSPGDKIEMKGTLKTLGDSHATGEVKAYVDKKLSAQAELSYILASKEQFSKSRLAEKQDEYFRILTRGIESGE